MLDYNLFLGSVCTNLGELETRRGRPEDALPWFARAIETFEEGVLKLEPRHAVTRYSLSYTHAWRARALGALGRHAAALADWERAIELDDRDDPALREGRDEARERLGRR